MNQQYAAPCSYTQQAPKGASISEAVSDTVSGTVMVKEKSPLISVVIYVTDHCNICEYSYEVADGIRRDFPQVDVRIVNLGSTIEEIPESVFATPTYLLNGGRWSLGNPSPQKVTETLNELVNGTDSQ